MASPDDSRATPASTSDDARSVGRGALLIALGKVVFLFAGAAINFVLPRLLSKADYGNYGVVIRMISLINMMTVIGLLQSVSKLVSEKPALARHSLRRALLLASVGSVAVAGLYAVLSPVVAGLLRDDALAAPIALSATITLGYGVYAVVMGTVNGLKRFKAQALLDMGFSVSKVVCILGGAVLASLLLADSTTPSVAGRGTAWAVGGFAVAAAVMAMVGLVSLRGLPAVDEHVRGQALPPRLFARRLLLFAGSVMLYQGSLNALMSADLLLVKRHVTAVDAGLAGVYNAAVNVAQLPYFGVLAITFVAFPLISATTFSEDRATTARYLRTAFRYGALIAIAVSAVVAGSAGDVINLIFPRGYEEGSLALAILVSGYSLLALHAIGCTLLNAAGHPMASFGATLAGTMLAVTVTLIALPVLGLVGAALGTLCGGALAFTLTVWLLRQRLGATPLVLSSLRIVAAGVAVGALGWVLPPRGVWLVVPFCLGMGLLFLGLLVVLRELGRDDLQVALAPFRRRRTDHVA
ncbi:MAG: oligosaccharide flippase family protein [Pseudomonadota bacterium]